MTFYMNGHYFIDNAAQQSNLSETSFTDHLQTITPSTCEERLLRNAAHQYLQQGNYQIKLLANEFNLVDDRQHLSSAYMGTPKGVLWVSCKTQLALKDSCELLRLSSQPHAGMLFLHQDSRNQLIASQQFLYYLQALLCKLSQNLLVQGHFSH